MLTINPTSSCDLCAENYSQERPPGVISGCGHVYCQPCLGRMLRMAEDAILDEEEDEDRIIVATCPECRCPYTWEKICGFRTEYLANIEQTPQEAAIKMHFEQQVANIFNEGLDSVELGDMLVLNEQIQNWLSHEQSEGRAEEHALLRSSMEFFMHNFKYDG